MNFSDHSDITTVTDLAQAKQSEYKNIDTTGRNVINSSLSTVGIFGTIAGYAGLDILGKALAASGGTGKAADLLQSKYGTNAIDIANAIDVVEHELAEAAITGNWDSPSLARAVSDLERASHDA